MSSPDPYTSVRVLREVRREAGTLTRQLAAKVNRNLNLSKALLAAIRYALRHVDEVAELVPDGDEDEDVGDMRSRALARNIR
jgi:hypothetical protein